METPVRFDDSLEKFVSVILKTFGDDAFHGGNVMRDAYGRLGYVSSRPLNEDTLEHVRDALVLNLGSYISKATAVLTPRDFGTSMLLSAPATWRRIAVPSGEPIWVDVIDRCIVGQDWIAQPPDEAAPTPPRIAFTSMKGGVGRSTALCVLAVHLARQGRNVLVVDGDLEAPGLGPLLIDPDERPLYGLLDYLVENALGGWHPEDFEHFVAPCLLTDRAAGQGLVDVVPVIGRYTLNNPSDMLAKLSRALVEHPVEDASPKSVRQQLREFIDIMSSRRSYDAILVDARAGFSEIAAGVILGLGARVLLFGVNQLQTFEDYKFLLAHMAHFARPGKVLHDWRRRIRFVHAKADPQGDDVASFKDRLYEVVAKEFYEDEESSTEPFNYSLDDPQAPHTPIVINFDFPYMRFDPVRNSGQLKLETYQAGFAEFLQEMNTILRFDLDQEMSK